ncbi:MAG TPA: hypothetical protein VJ742_09195, partial [Nitrososphaera sp.]|nr:hypothetical protein [Nitrososphaera sp.]
LTAVMSKRVEPKAEMKGNSTTGRYSSLNSIEKKEAIENCARLTGRIFSGLDLRKEILSVDNQKLGDTLLIKDAKNSMDLAGFAICHSGPETEAGSGNCYVKFAAISPGYEAAEDFVKLLNECEQYANASNAMRLVAGANTGRHKAYVAMMEQGFRTDMQGVAMHKPDEAGYNLPEVYLIDDWR